MPYIIASIIAIASSIVILLSRYEADDSFTLSELERMKVMFSTVDGFVNTYIESGESISDINFEVLNDNGILLGNSVVNGNGRAATMRFPHSVVVWHLIPNRNDASSYKLLINMTANAGLMSKSRFSESFAGREYCEKELFGTFETNTNSYKFDDVGQEDFINNSAGSNDDGIFACIVFK